LTYGNSLVLVFVLNRIFEKLTGNRSNNTGLISANNAILCFEKLLPSTRTVQLIVFFAAIREILKKEIYGGDKQKFVLLLKHLKGNGDCNGAAGRLW